MKGMMRRRGIENLVNQEIQSDSTHLFSHTHYEGVRELNISIP